MHKIQRVLRGLLYEVLWTQGAPVLFNGKPVKVFRQSPISSQFTATRSRWEAESCLGFPGLQVDFIELPRTPGLTIICWELQTHQSCSPFLSLS